MSLVERFFYLIFFLYFILFYFDLFYLILCYLYLNFSIKSPSLAVTQTQYNHVEQKVADLWMDGCQVQRFSNSNFGANKEAHISIYFDQIL